MAKQYSTQEIQKKLLEIVKEFDEFCRNNDIEYYLMGGSALGAMRHNGFIPWDDDIDVFMTYKNYTKFLQRFKDYNKKKYFLQVENTDEWPLFLSQVRVNNTTFISNDFKNNKKMHHGLFIDIMCLYDAPQNTALRFIQYCFAMCLKVNALYKANYSTNNIVKKCIMKFSKIIVNKYTREPIFNYVKKYENKQCSYVAHYFGRARFRYTSFPKEYLGKQRYVKFEDTMLPVMENVEKYLQVRYGERWNEMPNKKTLAKYPSHGSIVDLENDYSKYI